MSPLEGVSKAQGSRTDCSSLKNNGFYMMGLCRYRISNLVKLKLVRTVLLLNQTPSKLTVRYTTVVTCGNCLLISKWANSPTTGKSKPSTGLSLRNQRSKERNTQLGSSQSPRIDLTRDLFRQRKTSGNTISTGKPYFADFRRIGKDRICKYITDALWNLDLRNHRPIWLGSLGSFWHRASFASTNPWRLPTGA